MSENNNSPVLFANVAKRVLTVFFLLDCSSSMEDEGRMARLNDAIPTTIESIKSLLEDNPNLAIKVKTIKFSTTAEWHIGGSGGVDINSFVWDDLTADGITATAKAVDLLCDQLEIERMPRRGYPPVCVMISDGFCTDTEEAYDKAIARLNSLPWGRKAARIVVAIGNETDYDEDFLSLFVNDKGSFVKCEESSNIVEFIRLKTTEATISASESGNMISSQKQEDDELFEDDIITPSEENTDANPDNAW